MLILAIVLASVAFEMVLAVAVGKFMGHTSRTQTRPALALVTTIAPTTARDRERSLVASV